MMVLIAVNFPPTTALVGMVGLVLIMDGVITELTATIAVAQKMSRRGQNANRVTNGLILLHSRLFFR